MTALEKYFILVIVVWRITHLIASEDGPFEIIFKIRKMFGETFFGKLMDCFYCLSIWVGFVAAFATSYQIKEILLLTFYYSGASILLEKQTNKSFI
jgi:hypothetical protein